VKRLTFRTGHYFPLAIIHVNPTHHVFIAQLPHNTNQHKKMCNPMNNKSELAEVAAMISDRLTLTDKVAFRIPTYIEFEDFNGSCVSGIDCDEIDEYDHAHSSDCLMDCSTKRWEQELDDLDVSCDQAPVQPRRCRDDDALLDDNDDITSIHGDDCQCRFMNDCANSATFLDITLCDPSPPKMPRRSCPDILLTPPSLRRCRSKELPPQRPRRQLSCTFAAECRNAD